MRAVSLFAGVGGFDLACQRAGIDVVAAVEIDKAARSVLARRFPATRLYEDVQRVHAYRAECACEDCLPDGRVDLVCGGFPCQDLSVAGRRAGLAGLRSGLFFELARIVSELRPRWVLLENVPGLLSSNDGRDMAAVVGTLGDLGYGWAYRVLDAQFFGVPQRRRRVFIVGCAGDRAAPVEVLLEPESGSGDSPPSRATGTRVAPCLESGANSTGGTRPPGTTVDTAESLVVSTLQGGAAAAIGSTPKRLRAVTSSRRAVAALTANGVGTCGADDNQAQAGHLVAHTLTGEGHDAREVGTGRGTPLVVTPINADALRGEGVAATPSPDAEGRIRLRDPGLGVGQPGDPAGTLAAAGPGAIGFHFGSHPAGDEYERATTVTTRNGDPGGVSIGAAVRRLTPMECERLQGFPDDWTAGQSDSARYKQMGNAVAVPVVEWIMRRLVAVDGSQANEAVA